jgi:hypothetical protein
MWEMPQEIDSLSQRFATSARDCTVRRAALEKGRMIRSVAAAVHIDVSVHTLDV